MTDKNNTTDKKLMISDRTKIKLGNMYPPPYTDKQKAVCEMVEKGMDLTRAVQIAGYQDISSSKQKFEKYFLTHPVMLRKGKKIFHKLADDFLHDKGNVKDSTALRLVEIQQDRINPAVKIQHNLDTKVSFCRIDLTEIRTIQKVEGGTQKDTAIECNNADVLPPADISQIGHKEAFKNNEL